MRLIVSDSSCLIDLRKASLLEVWCLRCLLLVMCTYPFAKKALTLHLARGEGRERYFGCNLIQRKVLASSHQHLMAEAPPHQHYDHLSNFMGFGSFPSRRNVQIIMSHQPPTFSFS